MKKIVLISCVSKKGNRKTKAKDLYESPLFVKSLTYGKKLNPDNIYILSAQHHLLELDTEIEPYDRTLNKMSKYDRTIWGKRVIEQLQKVADIKKDKFIILAGQNYLTPIQNCLSNIDLPLNGKKIGERLQFLTNEIK
jgi:hypothetical protein